MLAKEGGYVNDARDPGGETKFGISKRAWPDVDIKNLTRDQAKSIYFTAYWSQASCYAFPAPLDLILLDAAVHHGVSSAVKQMQRAIGVKADGQVGPTTIAAAQTILARPGIVKRALIERAESLRIAPAADTYFKGWMSRVLDLHDASKESK